MDIDRMFEGPPPHIPTCTSFFTGGANSLSKGFKTRSTISQAVLKAKLGIEVNDEVVAARTC